MDSIVGRAAPHGLRARADPGAGAGLVWAPLAPRPRRPWLAECRLAGDRTISARHRRRLRLACGTGGGSAQPAPRRLLHPASHSVLCRRLGVGRTNAPLIQIPAVASIPDCGPPSLLSKGLPCLVVDRPR